jgi:hypothetical protein
MLFLLNHRVRMKIEEDLRSFDPMCNVLFGSSEGGFLGKFCGRRYFFYSCRCRLGEIISKCTASLRNYFSQKYSCNFEDGDRPYDFCSM